MRANPVLMPCQSRPEPNSGCRKDSLDAVLSIGASWYANYKQRYGNPRAFTVYAYETARVALHAIQRAGRKDRAAIRDAVFATHDYDGVLDAGVSPRPATPR